MTGDNLAAGVRRRGSGYQAVLYVGRDPVTGRKVRRSKMFTDKRQAAAWLRVQRGKGAGGGTPETLGSLLARWLEHQTWRVEVDGSLSAATRSWYRSAVERHLAPAPIAGVRLRDLTGDDLRRFVAAKAQRGRLDGRGGLGRSSLRRLSVVLGAALGWAHSEGWIPANPAQAVRFAAPRGSESARELASTVADLRRFLEHHAGHRMAAAWRLQAVTGARRGEVLGLRWSDLAVPDIGPASVTIKRAWTMVDSHPVLGETKTVGSARTVPIDAGTVETLTRWRDRQATDAVAWGDGWHRGGWIVTREDGSPVRPDTFTRTFKAACVAAGVPVVTPHTLRHLAATLLLEGGVPTKVVADVLGHSSTRVTAETYQHVRESMAAQAVGRIADQLT